MNPAEFKYLDEAEEEMWWFRGMNRLLFGMVDRYVGGSEVKDALEVGCGTGYLASLLETRRQWRVTGVDLGSEALRFARRRLHRLVQADLRYLPFPAASFPVLISMDVIVHLQRGEESHGLQEFWRVLKPNGLMFLRVSALDILRSRHSEFAHERQRFTRGRLVRGLRTAGFEVLRCTYMNSLLLPVALLKFRLWEPLTRQPPASGVYRYPALLNRVLEAPLRAESVLLNRGLSLPLGQSLFAVARKPFSP
ncbi:MAG TPA: class I SAM-dependent methyltransferase [Bryobacteraceae bacterium]|nr:class I SAM-dependent methyltransferase [Bryobacteraceae bacterium]